jgi:acyl-CoA synthetase (AMP-forming)/AMP-acid ligase II
VHAIVVLQPDMTVTGDELRAHCRELIAGYKVPKLIEISAEPLPKSGPGKILKRVLRDRQLAK